MARPKSMFLKAWGTMFQIIKALVDEVLSMGGNDESIRLILTNQEVRQSVAKILVDASKSTKASTPEPKPLLKQLNIVAIPAPATTKKFVVADHFKVGIWLKKPKISYIGDNFKQWFGDKVEEPISETNLCSQTLLRDEVDGPIIAELGGETKAETTLTEVYTLLQKQSNGQSGVLLTDGYANIFYIRDSLGLLRAVLVGWNDVGWDVGASSVGHPFGWDAGGQVFSRNS